MPLTHCFCISPSGRTCDARTHFLLRIKASFGRVSRYSKALWHSWYLRLSVNSSGSDGAIWTILALLLSRESNRTSKKFPLKVISPTIRKKICNSLYGAKSHVQCTVFHRVTPICTPSRNDITKGNGIAVRTS